MEKLDSIFTRIDFLNQNKSFDTKTISWEWDLSLQESNLIKERLVSQNWPYWSLKDRELTLWLNPNFYKTILHNLKFTKDLHDNLCKLKGCSYEKTYGFTYYYVFNYLVNGTYYKTYLTIDFKDKEFYVRWEYRENLPFGGLPKHSCYDIIEASANFEDICKKLEEFAKPLSLTDRFFNLIS